MNVCSPKFGRDRGRETPAREAMLVMVLLQRALHSCGDTSTAAIPCAEQGGERFERAAAVGSQSVCSFFFVVNLLS
jgi:hypothetical protein